VELAVETDRAERTAAFHHLSWRKNPSSAFGADDYKNGAMHYDIISAFINRCGFGLLTGLYGRRNCGGG
jgi:hypothetical protein